MTEGNTLWTTYYTPGYADLAATLISSAAAVGVDLWAVPVPSLGSWESNCCRKASFLRQVAAGTQGRPVAWVDADAVFRRHPGVLTYDAPIAAHRLRRPRRPPELLSGTIWLRNDDECRRLLRLWEAECEAGGAAEWDQVYLDRVIRREGAKLGDMSAELCWIYDTSPAIYGDHWDPAIVHYQASRDVHRGRRKL